MPYTLRARESVRRGIKRVAAQEIDSAIDRLTKRKDRDEAVHDARKSVKKVRGALRLVRFDFAKQFQVENAAFRDIGRKLSELRDAKALLEVFDDLIQEYKDQLGRGALGSVRSGLIARKKQFEAANNVEAIITEVVTDLRLARVRMEAWPLTSNGFAAVAPGLATTFRQGRNAFAAARDNPLPENYHEWRKRVKDHWYHIRLLENLWTPVMQAYEKSLKHIEQHLGDDHNLVVLRQAAIDDPSHFTNKREMQTLFNLTDVYQGKLRLEAQNIGERIYGQKPRELVAQMQHLWEAWKHEGERSWARRTLPARKRLVLATPA